MPCSVQSIARTGTRIVTKDSLPILALDHSSNPNEVFWHLLRGVHFIYCTSVSSTSAMSLRYLQLAYHVQCSLESDIWLIKLPSFWLALPWDHWTQGPPQWPNEGEGHLWLAYKIDQWVAMLFLVSHASCSEQHLFEELQGTTDPRTAFRLLSGSEDISF